MHYYCVGITIIIRIISIIIASIISMIMVIRGILHMLIRGSIHCLIGDNEIIHTHLVYFDF